VAAKTIIEICKTEGGHFLAAMARGSVGEAGTDVFVQIRGWVVTLGRAEFPRLMSFLDSYHSLFPHPYLGKSPSNSDCRRISPIMYGSCAAGAIKIGAFSCYFQSLLLFVVANFPLEKGTLSPEPIRAPLFLKS
jgi:hypothetical protein